MDHPGPRPDVEWRALTGHDLGGVTDLARRCRAVDGGLPSAESAGFLRDRYTGVGVAAVGAVADGRLVAAGALRPAGDGVVLVGQVDPAHRGLGLGSGLLDRLLHRAGERLGGELAGGVWAGGVRVETESVTAAADDLFRSRGLRPEFAEDVLRRDLSEPLPAAPLPPGITITEWTDHDRGDFFAAYRQAFADRPGAPDRSPEQWFEWTVDDDFLPSCSLLARAAGGPGTVPVGFVTCARGFLIQIGTVPAWRRRGLSRALAVAAFTRMRASGVGEVFLDVNVNNPASAALFQDLGCTVVARRARYVRVA